MKKIMTMVFVFFLAIATGVNAGSKTTTAEKSHAKKYDKIITVNTSFAPYTWRLLQITETDLIFTNYELSAFPHHLQYYIAVSRASIKGRRTLRKGQNLFLIASHFGYVETVTMQDTSGFDVVVKKYDVYYPPEK